MEGFRNFGGAAADTLPNSSALSRLLAKANSAPAPPRACGRVIESCFVNCPTSSELEPAVGATDVWASICTEVRTKRPHSQTAACLVSNRCVLDIIFVNPWRPQTAQQLQERHDHTPVPLFVVLRAASGFVREGLACPSVALADQCRNIAISLIDQNSGCNLG